MKKYYLTIIIAALFYSCATEQKSIGMTTWSDDGKEYKIFGEYGVENTAKEYNKDYLGEIPLNKDLRVSADKGEPLVYSQPEHKISLIFKKISESIYEKLV